MQRTAAARAARGSSGARVRVSPVDNRASLTTLSKEPHERRPAIAKADSATDHDAVERYLGEQPESYQTTLRDLRALIRAEAPEAGERFSYGVVVYKQIYDLVGLGVTKTSCSFYTMSPDLVKAMKDELKGVKRSGATIHLTPGRPLPEELIRKIVRARVAANETRAAQKRRARGGA